MRPTTYQVFRLDEPGLAAYVGAMTPEEAARYLLHEGARADLDFAVVRTSLTSARIIRVAYWDHAEEVIIPYANEGGMLKQAVKDMIGGGK